MTGFSFPISFFHPFSSCGVVVGRFIERRRSEMQQGKGKGGGSFMLWHLSPSENNSQLFLQSPSSGDAPGVSAGGAKSAEKSLRSEDYNERVRHCSGGASGARPSFAS